MYQEIWRPIVKALHWNNIHNQYHTAGAKDLAGCLADFTVGYFLREISRVYVLSFVGDMVAQWLVCRTWDQKVESLSPRRCTHVVFLGKTLNSYSASLHPGI